MKLSQAQAKVMERAKKDIDTARSYDTFEEWKANTDSYLIGRGLGVDYVREHMDYYGAFVKYYEMEKRGEVLTHCNSRTLKKLEEMGLIEIIRDSKGESFGIDVIKVLNY